MHQRLPRTTTPRQDIPFVYAAYHRLIRELGAIDGLSSAIFLSTRSLAKVAGTDVTRQRAIIERRATRFEINTRFVDFRTLEPRATQLLLVGIYQQVEAFVDSLRRERSRMGDVWRDRRDGETKPRHLMACLGDGFDANLKKVGEERWEILEYYRTLRNAFAHQGSDSDELAAAFSKVRAYRNLVHQEYDLNAPNHVDGLTYDDYLLATRVAKYLATDWCRLSAPNSAAELIALLEHEVIGGSHAMIGRRGNRDRLRKWLRSWLKQEYGYLLKDSAEIEESIIEWIEALPNKRGRKNKDSEGKSKINSMANYIKLSKNVQSI